MIPVTSGFSSWLVDEQGEVVLRLAGDLDMESEPEFELAVEALGGQRDRLVFDMSAVTFIDSSGLRVIARTLTRLQRDGGSLLLRGTSPRVVRALQISCINKVDIVEIEPACF
jgi:anti-sigma B factor antagonist